MVWTWWFWWWFFGGREVLRMAADAARGQSSPLWHHSCRGTVATEATGWRMCLLTSHVYSMMILQHVFQQHPMTTFHLRMALVAPPWLQAECDYWEAQLQDHLVAALPRWKTSREGVQRLDAELQAVWWRCIYFGSKKTDWWWKERVFSIIFGMISTWLEDSQDEISRCVELCGKPVQDLVDERGPPGCERCLEVLDRDHPRQPFCSWAWHWLMDTFGAYDVQPRARKHGISP